MAVAVAISPFAIVAMVLLLGSRSGRSTGFGFLAGWLAGLAVVCAVVLLVANPAGAAGDDGPAPWVGWLKIVLGVLAVLLAVKQWKDRPAPGADAELPPWMAALDSFKPARSFGMGFVLAAVNPKNLTLTLAAAVSIAAAGLSTGSSLALLGVFVVIGTVGLLVPVGIALFLGDRAAVVLDDISGWMAAHNSAIMAVLLLMIGAKLIGNGLGAT